MKYTIVVIYALDFYSAHKKRSRGNQLIHRCLTRSPEQRWEQVGRDGALVKSQPEGRGFDSRSSRQVGTSGKSFTDSCLPMRFGVKLRYCIRAVVGSASE